MWLEISLFFYKPFGQSLESISSMWIAGKKHAALNSICAAVLWSIWKLRNDLIFNGITWIDLKQIWWIALRTIKKRTSIFKESMMELVENFCQHFHKAMLAPLLLGPC